MVNSTRQFTLIEDSTAAVQHQLWAISPSACRPACCDNALLPLLLPLLLLLLLLLLPLPQVCQYRCIVSYESPKFEQFALCILQLHNCRNLDAKMPQVTRIRPAAAGPQPHRHHFYSPHFWTCSSLFNRPAVLPL